MRYSSTSIPKRVILLAFLVGYIVLLWFYHIQTRAYAISEAEKQMQDILLNHRAVHSYVEEVQKPVIYQLKEGGKLYEEFFAPELLSFTYIARKIKEYANKERAEEHTTELYFKLAADNPRNPINQADPYESSLLKRFNDDWELKSYREVIPTDSGDQLYFAMPIGANKPSCARCHSTPDKAPEELLERYGDKAGFYEQTGDIRAMVSIRIPLKRHLDDARQIFVLLALITLAVLVGIYLIIHLFSKRLEQANGELTDTNETLNTTNLHLASTLEELSQTQARLMESEKMASVGRMVAGMAHEINTPIGIAVGASSLMSSVSEELERLILGQDEVSDEELEPLLLKLSHSAELTDSNLKRAAALIRRVRSIFISQDAAGVATFSLQRLVDDVVEAISSQYSDSPVTVNLQVDDIEITGEQDSMVHLISNLIDNSMLHAFKDKIGEATITISASLHGDTVEIDYQDNGGGMSHEMAQKAFEPFVTSKRGAGMTGLGLYFCHSLVHGRMRGTMDIESSVSEQPFGYLVNWVTDGSDLASSGRHRFTNSRNAIITPQMPLKGVSRLLCLSFSG